MQVTCPKCDAKFKAKNADGTKVRCPECDRAFALPDTARKLRPALKRSDDDDATETKQPAKSGKGVILLLVGGAAALLLLAVVGLGATGLIIFLMRNKTPDAPPAPDTPVAKITLADARIDRIGRKLQLTVDFDSANMPEEEHIACYYVFPSDPHDTRVAKVLSTDLLRTEPKGKWACDVISPPQGAINDETCDIVVRTARRIEDLPTGKELARVAGVKVPKLEPLVINVSNISLKHRRGFGNWVDISFDCGLRGTMPDQMLIDVELIDTATNDRRTYTVSTRQGPNFPAFEKMTFAVNFAPRGANACNIKFGDSRPNQGNLHRIVNFPVQPAVNPADLAMSLTNPRIERFGPSGSFAKVSVDARALGQAPDDRNYHCGIIWSVGGSKQARRTFGSTLIASTLRNGTTVSSSAVAVPAGADPTCTIVIWDSAEQKELAVLANVPVPDVATKSSDRATITSARVEKIDSFRIKVAAEFEFNDTPDPNKVYTLLVQRTNLKGAGGVIVWQGKGSDAPKKMQVNQEINKNDLGTGNAYRLWLTVGVNPLDANTVCSNIKVVSATAAAPAAPIDISSVKFALLPNKKGSVIELTYKFTPGNLPGRTIYAGYFQPKGGNPIQFLQSPQGQMPAQGTFNFNTAYLLGNETEIEVWIVDVGAQGRVVSNKKLAEIKR